MTTRELRLLAAVSLIALASPAARADDRDEDPTLAKRAARGLAISPVPIDTSAMTHKQAQQVGLGSYIANGTSDCNGCHGSPAGFLAGGNPFAAGPGGALVWSRNLTPDPATGMPFTEAQFVEAIRTGKDRHDPARMLVVMPWLIFRWMSDADLKAVYAYLRAIPPVNNAVPPDNKAGLPVPASLPFPNFYNDGQVDRRLEGRDDSFPIERGYSIAPRAEPRDLDGEKAERYGRGSYIANSMTHCSDCHTAPDRTADGAKINWPAYLTGGNVYAVPPPLVPVLKQVRSMTADLKGKTHGFFSEADDSYQRFRAIITTGTHADETPPRPLGFPMNLIAANLGLLIEEDLRSIYTYVKAVPTVSGAADKITQNYARYCTADGDCHAGEACFSGTHECIGHACAADSDCDACQTCGAGHCTAPDATCVATAR